MKFQEITFSEQLPRLQGLIGWAWMKKERLFTIFIHEISRMFQRYLWYITWLCSFNFNLLLVLFWYGVQNLYFNNFMYFNLQWGIRKGTLFLRTVQNHFQLSKFGGISIFFYVCQQIILFAILLLPNHDPVFFVVFLILGTLRFSSLKLDALKISFYVILIAF